MSAFQYPFVSIHNGNAMKKISPQQSNRNPTTHVQSIKTKVSQVNIPATVLCKNCGVSTKYDENSVCGSCKRKLPIPNVEVAGKRKRDSPIQTEEPRTASSSSLFYGNKNLTTNQCNFYQKMKRNFQAIYSVNLSSKIASKKLLERNVKSSSQDCITISSDEEDETQGFVTHQSAPCSQTTPTNATTNMDLPDFQPSVAESTMTTITEIHCTRSKADDSNSECIDLGFTEERKTLFIYPPCGKQAIEVTTEDNYCLNPGEFLNDVIIEFYLKFIYSNILNDEQRDRSYFFSSFFYKSLTSPDKFNKDISIQERRHNKVKKWTRNVDLFEKDFIFVPINEAAHWYLAVICFPKLAIDQNWAISGTVNHNSINNESNITQNDTTESKAIIDEKSNNHLSTDESVSEQKLKDICRLSPCKVVIKALTEEMINNVSSLEKLELLLNPLHKAVTVKPGHNSAVNNDSQENNEIITKISNDQVVVIEHFDEAPDDNSAEDNCVQSDAVGSTTTTEETALNGNNCANEVENMDCSSTSSIENSTMSEEDNCESSGDEKCTFQQTFIKELLMENTKKCNPVVKSEGDNAESVSDSIEIEMETNLCQAQTAQIENARLLKSSEIAFHDFYYPQPCILIFDSLRGSCKTLVSKTLREYLTSEWNAKKKETFGAMEFTKDNIRMCTPQVPQQDNYSDCGIFLLHYVEMFFQKPINNFQIPIKHLKDWFESSQTISKRIEIQELVEVLNEEYTMNKNGLL